MYRFELPFPPSNNTYYRHVGDRVVLSKKGRVYKAKVREILQRLDLAGLMLKDLVVVRLELYRKDASSYDSDNFFKAVFDSLTYSKFWVDDDVVNESQARRKNYKRPNKYGRVVVYVDYDVEQGGFYE